MFLKACLKHSVGLPNVEFVASTVWYAIDSYCASSSGSRSSGDLFDGFGSENCYIRVGISENWVSGDGGLPSGEDQSSVDV